MAEKRRKRFDRLGLWPAKSKSISADKDLEKILGGVTRLPLKYWKERMFFLGARDDELFKLTGGHFPAKRLRNHRHPVFSLKPLPDSIGFMVCPCFSKRPYAERKYRYIKKGCRLLHTGHVMDRNSYLVEALRFNIPSSLASDLRFKGEAPEECIRPNI